LSNLVIQHDRALAWGPVRLLINWLWPRCCFVCGERAQAEPVCTACEARLPWLGVRTCPVCALPTPGGEVCGRCLRRTPYFDGSAAPFCYDTPLREMVLGLKHGQALDLAGYFARRMLPLLHQEVDLILPVPLHSARLRHRGFNQCVEIARQLGRLIGRPADLYGVVRDVDTPHQLGKRRAARRRNVRGVFRCRQDYSGMRILVIDDVMTSGATLDELARTLKLAGAKMVYNLVVARTLGLGRD
jgi:ComF family protein